LKMPMSAPPMTHIHKDRRVNATIPGINSNVKAPLKKSPRLPLAFPQNGMTYKNAFHIRQTNAERKALVSPKNTPQKRLNEKVVNSTRRNRRASNGPTTRAGHNARSSSAPDLTPPTCQEYSAANTRHISKLSSNEYRNQLLLCLETSSTSV